MPQFESTVVERREEAPGCVTLVLDPRAPAHYRAGQFLSIDPRALDATRDRVARSEAAKGRRERPRAYSLASAPHEPLLAITVKAEPDGLYPSVLTPHLVHGVHPGDTLPFSGFNGLYALPEALPPGAHVLHVVAGTGIVPNWSILKDALHRGVDVRHTLLYSSKSYSEMIYRTDL